jgi:hypothetical protein
MESELQDIRTWLQEMMKDLQDIRVQMTDLRGELRSQLDDIRGHIARVEQAAVDNSRYAQSLHSAQDVTRGDISNTQSTIESKIGHLDSKLDSVHSTVKEVRNKIR